MVVEADSTTPRQKSLAEPFSRSLRALAEWLAHTMLAGGIIGCITLIDRWLHLLLGAGNATFFGVLPVSWVFHAADLGVLVGTSYHGVKAALSAYRGEP